MYLLVSSTSSTFCSAWVASINDTDYKCCHLPSNTSKTLRSKTKIQNNWARGKLWFSRKTCTPEKYSSWHCVVWGKYLFSKAGTKQTAIIAHFGKKKLSCKLRYSCQIIQAVNIVRQLLASPILAGKNLRLVADKVNI